MTNSITKFIIIVLNSNTIPTMYLRKIYKALTEHLKNPRVTVLTGMRRTGKTTAVKYLMDNLKSGNKIYLDLENMNNRIIFSQKNYDSVLESFRQKGLNLSEQGYVFLDEIQFVPESPSVMKYLYDHYQIKFVVTGSSSYYLKNLFAESMAGRKKIFELFPLDFGEFLIFKDVPFKEKNFLDLKFSLAEYARIAGYYEEYIKYGGFPEVALAQTENDKKDFLNDIITSYLNIDIAVLTDFKNLKNAYNLMRMLAQRTGTRLDYAKISRLTGMGWSTVQNYIEFFEKSYLISRIPVFTNNPDREIVKAQKIYFCDNGLLSVLADTDGGVKFENAVFCQLRHYGNLQYFSLKNGREIDFILNGKTALEIKENPLEVDQNKLDNMAVKAGIRESRLIGRHQSPNFQNYIWGGEIK